MKRGLLLLTVFCALNVNAQNFLVTFAGTGGSTSVNTVIVENLRTGIIVTLNGDDVLQLTTTVGISDLEYEKYSRIKIYPNPMTEKAKLLISPPDEGDAIISVSDITGKIVTHLRSNLGNYPQEFTLSGLKNGLYIVNVRGNSYQFSAKLLSSGKSTGPAVIEKVGDKTDVDKQVSVMDTKGVQADVDMDYTMGDIIKFTGKSGIYSTVVTSILDADKTITFNFIACTDGDNNNYPVVEIGTQIWMAENLKTTKYNDGAEIPYKPVADEWIALSSPGYCWYNNDATANKDIYGALYNWYTLGTGNLCPTGWREPTDPEWTTLTISSGFSSTTGGRLKETGTTHWTNGAGATNETGFTGLPGGYRHDLLGSYSSIGQKGYWWSSTEVVGPGESISAWHRELTTGVTYVLRNNYGKGTGFSVRCIKE
jgi:uncharacterized protein (TIGR02145 family)